MKTPHSTTIFANCASDVPQVCPEARAFLWSKTSKSTVPGRVLEKLLCPGNSASPWFAASCCRDGSLATIQLLVTYIRPSNLFVLEKKDLVPPLLLLLPCWSVVIAASETGVSTKTGSVMGRSSWSPRWVGSHVPNASHYLCASKKAHLGVVPFPKGQINSSHVHRLVVFFENDAILYHIVLRLVDARYHNNPH